jgi:hypothetical protein
MPRKIVLARKEDKNVPLLWANLLYHIDHSQSKETRREVLMSRIINARIKDHKGTQKSFLLAIDEDLRQHELIVPPKDRMSNSMKIHFIKCAIVSATNLTSVWEQWRIACDNLGTPGKNMLYENYIQKLLVQASIYDKDNEPKKKRSINNHELIFEGEDDDDGSTCPPLEAHNHSTGSPYDSDSEDSDSETEYKANMSSSRNKKFPKKSTRKVNNANTGKTGPRRVYMDQETWNTLSHETRKSWDLISEDDKLKILKFAKQSVREERKPIKANVHDQDKSETSDETPNDSIQVTNVELAPPKEDELSDDNKEILALVAQSTAKAQADRGLPMFDLNKALSQKSSKKKVSFTVKMAHWKLPNEMSDLPLNIDMDDSSADDRTETHNRSFERSLPPPLNQRLREQTRFDSFEPESSTTRTEVRQLNTSANSMPMANHFPQQVDEIDFSRFVLEDEPQVPDTKHNLSKPSSWKKVKDFDQVRYPHAMEDEELQRVLEESFKTKVEEDEKKPSADPSPEGKPRASTDPPTSNSPEIASKESPTPGVPTSAGLMMTPSVPIEDVNPADLLTKASPATNSYADVVKKHSPSTPKIDSPPNPTTRNNQLVPWAPSTSPPVRSTPTSSSSDSSGSPQEIFIIDLDPDSSDQERFRAYVLNLQNAASIVEFGRQMGNIINPRDENELNAMQFFLNIISDPQVHHVQEHLLRHGCELLTERTNRETQRQLDYLKAMGSLKERLNAAESSLNSTIAQHKAEVDRYAKAMISKDDQYRDLQQEKMTLEQAFSDLRTDKNNLILQKAGLEDAITILEKDTEAMVDEYEQKDKALKLFIQEKINVERKLHDAEQRCKDALSLVDSTNEAASKRMKVAEGLINDLKASNFQLKYDLQHARDLINKLQANTPSTVNSTPARGSQPLPESNTPNSGANITSTVNDDDAKCSPTNKGSNVDTSSPTNKGSTPTEKGSTPTSKGSATQPNVGKAVPTTPQAKPSPTSTSTSSSQSPPTPSTPKNMTDLIRSATTAAISRAANQLTTTGKRKKDKRDRKRKGKKSQENDHYGKPSINDMHAAGLPPKIDPPTTTLPNDGEGWTKVEDKSPKKPKREVANLQSDLKTHNDDSSGVETIDKKLNDGVSTIASRAALRKNINQKEASQILQELSFTSEQERTLLSNMAKATEVVNSDTSPPSLDESNTTPPGQPIPSDVHSPTLPIDPSEQSTITPVTSTSNDEDNTVTTSNTQNDDQRPSGEEENSSAPNDTQQSSNKGSSDFA